jgi:hypothetical protein
LSWGTPFHARGVSTSLTLVASDAQLRALAEGAGPSALRAEETVATLNFLHFEAPNASSRTVVIELNLNRVTPGYLSDLASDLRHDRLLVDLPISTAFANSALGANGFSSSRTLITGTPPAWSAQNLTVIRSLSARVNSLSESAASLQPMSRWSADLLTSQARMAASARQHELSDVAASLANTVAAFHIASTTITLTGPGSPLPITVTSSVNYPVTGFVLLEGRGVQFPEGAAVPVTLSTATTALRIPVTLIGNGNFTLSATLVTADRTVVLAHAAIQVRSTTNSTLGYALSIASLLVIGLWWLRTLRRTRRGLHVA